MQWREEIFLREADFDRIRRGNLRLSDMWNSMAQLMSTHPNQGRRAYCFLISTYYSTRASECDMLWTEAKTHLEKAALNLESMVCRRLFLSLI